MWTFKVILAEIIVQIVGMAFGYDDDEEDDIDFIHNTLPSTYNMVTCNAQ